MKKEKKEVEYKVKAGTAWSHSYLNQKPWHPLSYPNQRRKWIAEQTHSQKEERHAEVAREFTQEQEFFRQTAQMSKKEKEKMEAMQAVSFMYIRPPGYNAEAARAAEIADERKKLRLTSLAVTSTADANADDGDASASLQDKKRKPRSKDVFGRTLPTEEEFPVLKNAPRHDTGGPVRVKPFAIEIRNVKCARCGAFGHQSGDRECPLKDVLMPNEEARLIREDPLNAILSQTASEEPLKWELKQQPGLSPARGGFKPDDPNQQIIPDDDIYDEYGGFLPGGGDEGGLSIPNLLASLSQEQRNELTDAKAKRKRKTKRKLGKEKTKHHLNRRKASSSAGDGGKYRPKEETESDRCYVPRCKWKSDSSNDEREGCKHRDETRSYYSDTEGRNHRVEDNIRSTIHTGDPTGRHGQEFDNSYSEQRSRSPTHNRRCSLNDDKCRVQTGKTDYQDNHKRHGRRKPYIRDDDEGCHIAEKKLWIADNKEGTRVMSEGRFDSSEDDQRDHRHVNWSKEDSDNEQKTYRHRRRHMLHKSSHDRRHYEDPKKRRR